MLRTTLASLIAATIVFAACDNTQKGEIKAGGVEVSKDGVKAPGVEVSKDGVVAPGVEVSKDGV
jgi:predicted small secreted protein